MLNIHPLKASLKPADVPIFESRRMLKERLSTLQHKFTQSHWLEKFIGRFFNVNWEDIIWMTQSE